MNKFVYRKTNIISGIAELILNPFSWAIKTIFIFYEYELPIYVKHQLELIRKTFILKVFWKVGTYFKGTSNVNSINDP